MKIIKWSLLMLVLIISLPLLAQKKNKFEDGVYTSYQDLKANKPSFPLYRIPDFDYKLDSEQNLLFLSDKSINQLSNTEIKSLDSIWGLCIKGISYIKVSPEGSSATYFVRFHILGSISYFYYPIIEDKEVEMYVYNPYLGAKVGRKTIVNKERKVIQKIMLFETGLIKASTIDNFKDWVKDDERLMNTLKDMTLEEQNEKLFKMIQIYNDRHPLDEKN